jgi:hypothetical protein
VSTTRQHIEDLDTRTWAALTSRAAADAVAAAGRLGRNPPAVLAVVAAMTEDDLVEHRDRFGPTRRHLSPVMQLVEADKLRVAAERQAREAQQDTSDAQAAASMARTEAEESARAATAARDRARAAQEEAARKDIEHTAEIAAAQQGSEELRGELERVRADAAAEVAAARGQASGEIAAAQQGAQAEVARAHADAEEAIARAHAEVEQIRVQASAQVAAAGEQADAEIAAARQDADTEIARVRAEARDAHPADPAHASVPGLLTIPIPPVGLRAHTGPIEEALAAVRDIDYLLEVGIADDAERPDPFDSERVRSLAGTVQQQAGDISQQLRDLPIRYGVPSQAEAAGGYARAAATAYGAYLQRIATATGQLSQRGHSADADVVAMLTTMLAEHPWRRR